LVGQRCGKCGDFMVLPVFSSIQILPVQQATDQGMEQWGMRKNSWAWHPCRIAFHMSVCVEAVLQMQRKGQPFLPIYRYITIANDIRPPPPGQRVNKSLREAGESADFFGIHLDVHVNNGAALPCHNAASVDESSPPDTHYL
jgi:hypothetical protein